jgi:hypothetical protein
MKPADTRCTLLSEVPEGVCIRVGVNDFFTNCSIGSLLSRSRAPGASLFGAGEALHLAPLGGVNVTLAAGVDPLPIGSGHTIPGGGVCHNPLWMPFPLLAILVVLTALLIAVAGYSLIRRWL